MEHRYARHKPMPISFRDPKTGRVFTASTPEEMARLEGRELPSPEDKAAIDGLLGEVNDEKEPPE